MTVTENLGALGSWAVTLSDDAPKSVLSQLGYFGHVAVFRGVVDVTASSDTTLLRGARYVGVLREKSAGGRVLSGSSMLMWLGDEDHKGKVIESKLVLTNQTLTQCLTAILPPAVTLGTVFATAGTYTGTHQWQTPRDALDVICTAFGVEYRVNGDGTLDVGTAAQLYNTTAPDSIISATGTGQDMDVQSLGSTFVPDVTAVDYTTRVVLVGQSTDSAGTSTQFTEATADAPAVPYLDIHGNPVQMTRLVSDPSQTPSSVTATAQLQLNRFNRTAQILTVTAEDYETSGNFVVGDNSYVYDPDNGIFDAAKEITFRGEVIHPAVVRISGLTWPVSYGHTVAFRTQSGTWIDLTPWVQWESGTTQVTVGDLPKTLTSGSNPVAGRQDAADGVPGSDISIPNAPGNLTLSTVSVLDAKGKASATLSATWNPPTLNTDGSVITDLHHYLVQYRWHGRAPLWDTRITADTSIDIPGLAGGLSYDVQVSAVDTTGHTSAPTAVASLIVAVDSFAPNPPSDPVVTSYLGQLRIAWDGKDNAGAAMPSDFSVVEVHVSSTTGFTPSAATMVDQLSAAGVSYATAPYASARYVKLVSVDNSGNRSTPSNQATGSTVQVADGDIAALSVGKLTAGTMSADVVIGGRFTTALTGARTEVNSLGFQKFASDGVTKMIDFTGTTNLLTGTLQTALTGRRLVVGAAGATGEINFYAPDNTQSFLRGYTESTGLEAIQMGITIPAAGGNSLWNRVNYNTDHGGYANYRANRHEFIIGDMSGPAGTDSANSGYFHVLATNNWGASSTERFRLDGNGMVFWGTTQTQLPRLQFAAADGYFYHQGNVAGRWHEMLANGQFNCAMGTDGFVTIYRDTGYGADNSSPSIRQQSSAGYGCMVTAVYIADVTSRIDFRDAANVQWHNLQAASFMVASSNAGKTDIQTLPSALDKVRGTRATKYKRRNHRPHHEHDDGAIPEWSDSEEIGLIAEEAPPEIVRNSGKDAAVDLYAMSTLTWTAVQELADQLDALRADIDGRKPKK